MAKYLGIPLTVSNGNKTPLTAQPEKLVNGDFSHPTDGWTFGNNTSIVGGKLVCTSSTAFSPTYQSVTISQKAYVVTFTIDSISGGSVIPAFQNSKNLTPRSAAGTYTEKVVAPTPSTRFEFYTTTAGVSFEISSVSFKEIAATETPTYGSPEYVTNGKFSDASDWSITNGGWNASGPSSGSWACDGTQTSSTNLAQPNVFQGLTDKKVVISFEITAYTAGSVRFVAGDGSITGSAKSILGTHETIGVVTNDATGLNIQADPDFVGSVSNVSVKEIPYVIGTQELLKDGSFPPNTTAWTFGGGATLEANGAKISNESSGGADIASIQQVLPFSVSELTGRTFELTYDVVATNGEVLAIQQSNNILLDTTTVGVLIESNF